MAEYHVEETHDQLCRRVLELAQEKGYPALEGRVGWGVGSGERAWTAMVSALHNGALADALILLKDMA